MHTPRGGAKYHNSVTHRDDELKMITQLCALRGCESSSKTELTHELSDVWKRWLVVVVAVAGLVVLLAAVFGSGVVVEALVVTIGLRPLFCGRC